MEAAEGDIEFGHGRFTIAGTDRSIDIMELARRLREGKMPEGVPSSLDVDHTTKDMPSTFPNGCHVAEVEIDPETGDGADRALYRRQRFRHHRQSDDRRRPVAWRRRARHRPGADGRASATIQAASRSPARSWTMRCRAPATFPLMAVGDHPVPAKSNPLGTKGCGEAGCAGSLVYRRQCGDRRAVRIRHHARSTCR